MTGLFIYKRMDYKPFLIQKLKTNSPVRDSREWDIWVKSIPFLIYPKLKEPAKRSWVDESGDDEYVPDTPRFEAYTMDVAFAFIGERGTANVKIRSFLSYLSQDGEFSIYDTYTAIGRTHVRYSSFSDDAFRRREGQNDLVEFKVTLKVNDPITEIRLSK